MTKHKDRSATPEDGRTLSVNALPLSLLDEPLEYIFADHTRQRVICSALQRIAAQRTATREEADLITAFLTQDRVLHEADEDADLFPAMRRRSLAADNLGAILARLRDDHRRSHDVIEHIVTALCRHPAREMEKLTAADCELMQSFASSESKHIAIENSVVLAIAPLRLSVADLKSISRGMKIRRGVTP